MADNLFVQAVKAIPQIFTGSRTTYQAPPAPTNYTVRGQTVTPNDLAEARKVIFAEVSNRPADKQELEARILLNTAINRQAAYSQAGKPMSLTQVLQAPNQYQGYNSPQYKLYSSTTLDQPTASKRTQINAIGDKLQNEIQGGQFTDNTNGAYYYQHNNQGQIHYDDRKPLFKSQPTASQSQSLFVNAQR